MKLIYLLSFCLSHLLVKAQTTFISGVVTDEYNRPVSLAIIDISGKNNSTVTDDDGKFGLLLRNISKGDLIRVRVTKKGFMIFSKQETVSVLPLLIQIKRINSPKAKNHPQNNKDSSIIQVTNASTALIVTQNQSGGSNTVNYIQNEYNKLDNNIKIEIENRLNLLAQSHQKRPLAIVEVESGNSQRGKVALQLEQLLIKDSLGVYFRSVNTGKFIDDPITVLVNPVNRSYCDRLLEILSIYVTGGYKVIVEKEVPVTDIRIYLNGNPRFDITGKVKFE